MSEQPRPIIHTDKSLIDAQHKNIAKLETELNEWKEGNKKHAQTNLQLMSQEVDLKQRVVDLQIHAVELETKLRECMAKNEIQGDTISKLVAKVIENALPESENT